MGEATVPIAIKGTSAVDALLHGVVLVAFEVDEPVFPSHCDPELSGFALAVGDLVLPDGAGEHFMYPFFSFGTVFSPAQH